MLVGRGIIVPRPASSVIASRRGSPLVVHFKSAGFCFFRAHIFAGLCRLVCARRRVRRSRDFLGWEVLGGSDGPPPGPPLFRPRPRQQNGLGGWAVLCSLDLESAASHFCPISGCSSLFSFFLFFYFIFENGRWRVGRYKREGVRKRRGNERERERNILGETTAHRHHPPPGGFYVGDARATCRP